MTIDPPVLLSRQGPVAVVTLNNPSRLNALSVAMHRQLANTWRELDADPSVRAIVVTGAGDRGFCAGMDLADPEAQNLSPEGTPRGVREGVQITPIQVGVYLPTVVAVNGVCAGAGLHFVSDADVVVASDRSSFVDTHVDVGQVTAIEPITLLPRIGLGATLRLAVLGRAGRLDPADALRIGLVDEVVPHDEVMVRALELARCITTASPAAIEASKRAIWGALERPLGEALQHGWDLLRDHRGHPDAQEGPRAFAARRTPSWTA